MTHILSVCSLVQASPSPEFTHLAVKCEDVPEAAAALLEELPAAFAFITGSLEGGGSVLIHCFAGHSRSVTVAAAYLIVVRGLSVEAALTAVRKARPGCCPNSGFMRLLGQLAAERDRVAERSSGAAEQRSSGAAEQRAPPGGRLLLSPATSGLVVR